MPSSLSILLPVFNREATLRRAAGLIDAAEDLSARFDMLIVDNGSTDHTAEVAHELAREFPQLAQRRFDRRQDLPTIVRTGLAATRGELVCLHEGASEIDLDSLRNLWQLRHEQDLVLARRGGSSRIAPTVERLLRGGPGDLADGSGFHMLRRDSLELLRSGVQVRIDHQEVRLRRDLPAAPAAAKPRQPNFLGRLRRLALGE